MPGATDDTLDPDVLGAWTDGDAVITGHDGGGGDGYSGGRTDVDAVGVGALRRRSYLHVLDQHIRAVGDHNVKHLAVHGRYATDHDIARPLERYRLPKKSENITAIWAKKRTVTAIFSELAQFFQSGCSPTCKIYIEMQRRCLVKNYRHDVINLIQTKVRRTHPSSHRTTLGRALASPVTRTLCIESPSLNPNPCHLDEQYPIPRIPQTPVI